MQTFKKEERLCSKKSIDFLFANGKSFYFTPFKIKWLYQDFETDYPVQIMIVVPKRYFKKAHERNKIKRQIREAYRINKFILYDSLKIKEKKISLAIIYNGKEISSYKLIEEKIILILQRLIL
ncbi:MAG: ribonuclease P protein component [Bacteroidetes bacterium]|nr:ribonuclease P protein component [Bacteroidota bacterium]